MPTQAQSNKLNGFYTVNPGDLAPVPEGLYNNDPGVMAAPPPGLTIGRDPGIMEPLAPSSGEMRSWTPNLSDRAAQWLGQNLFGDTREGTVKGHELVDMANMTPIGAATSAYDTSRALAEGNVLAASGSILATFGGPMAKTANSLKLNVARMLEKRGATADEIWGHTGWFRAADAKWKFEIPDTEAAMRRPPEGQPIQRLGDVLHHPQLYAAYPELADVPVGNIGERNMKAMYQPPSAGEPAQMGFSPSVIRDPAEFVSSALHEASHGVAHIEGFAKGANTVGLRMGTPAWGIYTAIRQKMLTPITLAEYAKAAGFGSAREAESSYREYLGGITSMAKKGIPRQLDLIAQQTAVEEAYHRSAGEVEARNVQRRHQQNRLHTSSGGGTPYAPTVDPYKWTPPWTTQDVPNEEQIVDYFRK